MYFHRQADYVGESDKVGGMRKVRDFIKERGLVDVEKKQKKQIKSTQHIFKKKKKS